MGNTIFPWSIFREGPVERLARCEGDAGRSKKQKIADAPELAEDETQQTVPPSGSSPDPYFPGRSSVSVEVSPSMEFKQ
ncbi:MAG: hypothetical protein AVO35_12590 [Candidatus Aegiribacteria sp. MLS_C]|nr:MAG: hypothetical protein AVO35_12590 [Candidatus Aegiribacteria sp. MLS_C]